MDYEPNFKLHQEAEEPDLDFIPQQEATDQGLDLASQQEVEPKEPTSTTFEEMSVDKLADALDTTIKYDRANKVILFLAMLSAYTEEDQLNVCLLGQSSSGKTYLAQQVARYFPQEDIKEYAEVSPTAFKYVEAVKDPKTGKKYVDLERKILLFTEMPDSRLLANLRPVLSHDRKETEYVTTNKAISGKNRAETSSIRGFSAVIFCSTYTRLDEQEITRSILLSPETNIEKLEASLELASKRSADREAHRKELESDPILKELGNRVKYVKSLNIQSVIIENPGEVLKKFKEINPNLSPRSQRDITHLYSIIKAVAMLNAGLRLNEAGKVVASEADIEAGVGLWKEISKTQILGVPPAVYGFYEDYIVPAYGNIMQEKVKKVPVEYGITFDELAKFYHRKTGTVLHADSFKRMHIPALKGAGMISYEPSKADKRVRLIRPLV